MTIDPHTLEAGRETDKLVAESVGWLHVGYRNDDHGAGLTGYAPGEPREKDWREVPRYSTTDAALDALEQYQEIRRKIVKLSLSVHPYNSDGKWFAMEYPAGKASRGPTLYLAICRLIYAALGKENNA